MTVSNKSKPLRVGVAGCGVFGGYHAQKYRNLSEAGYDIELIGFYDQNADSSKAMSDRFASKAFLPDELEVFLDSLDAITVATPAFSHAEIALKALQNGVHVYSEKPLATTRHDADAMVNLAGANGLVLACGHQERVIFEAIGLYDIDEKPLRLEAIRNGVRSTRNLDVSVVLDLMIHDLDLAVTLGQGEAGGLSASAKYVEEEGYRGQGADQVHCVVGFDNGFQAHFAASRMSLERERRMRIDYASGSVDIDFLSHQFVNTTPHKLNPDFANSELAKDPLGISVSRFIDTIIDRRNKPLCSGQEASLALHLALAIDEILEA